MTLSSTNSTVFRRCQTEYAQVTDLACITIQLVRAYSFWHLKSAKSSERVGFAENNSIYRKNVYSENGRVGRLCREKFQKNTHSENSRFFYNPIKIYNTNLLLTLLTEYLTTLQGRCHWVQNDMTTPWYHK